MAFRHITPATARALIGILVLSIALAGVSQIGAGSNRALLAMGIAAAALALALVLASLLRNRTRLLYALAVLLLAGFDYLTISVLGRGEAFGFMTLRILSVVLTLTGLLWLLGPFIRERLLNAE